MIDGRKVALSTLKQNRHFLQFEQCLREALEDARNVYENQPANDFNRGRVAVLKELINDINS